MVSEILVIRIDFMTIMIMTMTTPMILMMTME